MQGKGLSATGLSTDWADLIRHKRAYTDRVPEGAEKRLADNGIATFHGHAQFVSPNQLDIDGTEHRAKRFLIAAGARPRSLGFPGREYVTDSTDFLNLDALPQRIVFVGGGFISFEFAHIAARAGAECVIVQHGDRPLREFDPDLVELLVRRTQQAGIRVHQASTVTAVTRAPAELEVAVERGGVTSTIRADLVVHGAGRVPNLDGLNLEAGNIASSMRGVSVFEHLQSISNPDVYAAGDVADTVGKPLTPVAVIEGKVAASNLLKNAKTVPDYAGVPTTVFTVPELTRVGMLESDAHENGYNVTVRYNDTSRWYSNFRVGESTAATKLLIDKDTDQILGAHLLGPGYAELVNLFGLAIKLGLTTRQLTSFSANYPSIGSDLHYML
ncbi:NAD(P)/FAD-dependent oxidoreductase [Leifsonia sp. ku-ls]|nr:NAD(P)/FAD-dependent oxidoreductase [Leifsonia sp. ku-ls]